MNNNEQPLEPSLDPQDQQLLNDIQDSEEGLEVDTYELSDSCVDLYSYNEDSVLLNIRKDVDKELYELSREDLKYLLKQIED